MRSLRFVLVAVLATVVVVFGPASPAGADELDDAAAALRQDPVYNDPDAERALSEPQVEELRAAIRSGDAPVYVAVLTEQAIADAGGDPDAVPGRLGELTGLRGTYAVLAGGSFRAASNALPRGVAGDIATDAFNDHRGDGPAAVLRAFVERVQTAATGGAGGAGGSPDAVFDGSRDTRSGEGSGDSGGDGGGIGLLPILLLGGGAFAFFSMRRANKRRAQERQLLLGDQQDLRAELSVLASDVMRLEPEVVVHPEARTDYDAAVGRFQWLQAAIDAIDSDDDIPRLRRAMAEARYAMARAQAIVRGQTPPEPPEELRQPGRYGEPPVRVDDRGEPEYVGYGPGAWGGGGFFGGNGMLSGLLIGSMLGGGFGGWGHGGDGGAFERGYEAGQDDGDGFGDFGGGDFGGGDFDFGGGDVGGGDFG